jgi:hypothetical protein
MTPAAFKLAAFLTLLFLLGPLLELIFRRTLPRGGGGRLVSLTGVCLGGLFVLTVLLYRLALDLGGPQQSVSAGGNSQGLADILTVFSLVVGLIGVVLTILTGLSITAAWRAMDDADRALKKTEGMIRDAEEVATDILRLAAYVEAVDRLGAARTLTHKRRDMLYRAELAAALGRKDSSAVLDYLADVLSNQDLINQIGDQGVRFLEAIEIGPLSLKRRRTLHAVLAILEENRRS